MQYEDSTSITFVRPVYEGIYTTILESEYGIGTIPNRNIIKSLEIKQVPMFYDVFQAGYIVHKYPITFIFCIIYLCLIPSNPFKSKKRLNQNTSSKNN